MIDDLKLTLKISQRELTHIFWLVDSNADGRVSKEELISAFLSMKSSIS
jgi:hypothetical protein